MSEFQWVALALVAITSAARITRLVTKDKWPPVVWLRMRWDALTDKPAAPGKQGIGGWNLLLHCGYCFSAWAMTAVVAWGYLTDWQTAWWLVNGTLGGSYLAVILMANDGDR